MAASKSIKRRVDLVEDELTWLDNFRTAVTESHEVGTEPAWVHQLEWHLDRIQARWTSLRRTITREVGNA